MYINIKFRNEYLALFHTSVNRFFCLLCNNCKIPYNTDLQQYRYNNAAILLQLTILLQYCSIVVTIFVL